MPQAFPAKIPPKKPTDRPLSAATQRMYEVWNPYGDLKNEFCSNFLYSHIDGLPHEPNVSRRDPSKVIRVNGTYYVYYTSRRTSAPPAGPEGATDTVPSRDWDLADIWCARSSDGFTWEEVGPVTQRPPKGEYGCRTNCTPDILVWKGKYYLYFQAYDEAPAVGDCCSVSMAESDSPTGPFISLGRPVVPQGAPGEWDQGCIHDPYPLVYRGRIHLYYKGSPGPDRGGENMIRAWGVAIAGDPAGPFEKSPLNPVTNSGHETCLWPYREGICALVSLDGPEKNTVQFAADGLNFEEKAHIVMPPMAPGPFVPDAFADNGDGQGITWGLCHLIPKPAAGRHESVLIRFDCDLSRKTDRPFFKEGNRNTNEGAHFEWAFALPASLRDQIQREQTDIDTDTIGAG